MNIEQIAQEVADELFLGGKAVGHEPAEFLRRCLSKLAEQDVGRANWKPLPEDQNERITFDRALHNIYEGDARLAVAITLRTFANAMSGGTFADTCRVMANEVAKLYTETKLLAAQQRTAEACAKAVERLIGGDGLCADDGVWIHDCAEAIRNGDWREYL